MKTNNLHAVSDHHRDEQFVYFHLREFPRGSLYSYTAPIVCRLSDRKWGVIVTRFYDSTRFGYVSEDCETVWVWHKTFAAACAAAFDEFRSRNRMLRAFA